MKIEFPEKWRQRGFAKQLKEKVKEVKENNPNRNAETMARKYGHEILRLPRNFFFRHQYFAQTTNLNSNNLTNGMNKQY